MNGQPRHPLDNKFGSSKSSGSDNTPMVLYGIIEKVNKAFGDSTTGWYAKDVTYDVKINLPQGPITAKGLRPLDRYPFPFKIVPRAKGLPVVCYYNNGSIYIDFHERLFLEECPPEG